MFLAGQTSLAYYTLLTYKLYVMAELAGLRQWAYVSSPVDWHAALPTLPHHFPPTSNKL